MPTVAVRGLVFAGDTHAPAWQPALPALTDEDARARHDHAHRRKRSAPSSTTSAPRAATRPRRPRSASRPSGMARDLPLLLDVLADELRNPAFNADELAKAKAELENDVPARRRQHVAARAGAARPARRIAPGPSVLARRAAPRVQSLGALGDADLRDFHRARYVGAGHDPRHRRRRRRRGDDRAGGEALRRHAGRRGAVVRRRRAHRGRPSARPAKRSRCAARRT